MPIFLGSVLLQGVQIPFFLTTLSPGSKVQVCFRTTLLADSNENRFFVRHLLLWCRQYVCFRSLCIVRCNEFRFLLSVSGPGLSKKNTHVGHSMT
jgi:hypothetical protein